MFKVFVLLFLQLVQFWQWKRIHFCPFQVILFLDFPFSKNQSPEPINTPRLKLFFDNFKFNISLRIFIFESFDHNIISSFSIDKDTIIITINNLFNKITLLIIYILFELFNNNWHSLTITVELYCVEKFVIEQNIFVSNCDYVVGIDTQILPATKTSHVYEC